ncbi:MAG: MmgE/PrpD family protein [Rhodospirillum sp.]|nr:MmgE/PrpD family protein [Rhodospirillum sp.]MCF8488574.1 MmgE/PrpD family protein [Rhodospirillum sp.]MCF8499170.1 MmgE/PrpD family protein [Rhodospirillum sp.]
MSESPDTPGVVERRLGGFVETTAWEDIPEAVRHQAKRSILNILATAFAGSGEAAIDKALAVMAPFSGAPTCPLVGRSERVDPALAAFLNAAAANIHDFDDTHPPTIIHPTAPVAPALFAFAEGRGIAGRALLRAFIVGAEVECRLGNALSPYHYARGWHITSTCGAFGAALGVGALLGLDQRRLTWAMGNAAAQAAGLVETLGTMAKSVSVGNAARGGLLAALLARVDYDGPPAPISGLRGFARVHADAPDLSRLTNGLGADWEIRRNTYKPYPVGVVLNPVIDACLSLRAEGKVGWDAIERVTLRGHPLLRQRTDRPDVDTGRLSQVSAQHAIAIVLKTGEAGVTAFSDPAVAETLGKRPTVAFVDEPERDIASVSMEVVARDGSRHTVEIAAAKGTPDNPLTDVEIEDKLRTQARAADFPGDIEALIGAVWGLETSSDAASVLRLAARPAS